MMKKKIFTSYQSHPKPKLICASVIGPSHVGKGIPNQDACLTFSKGQLHMAIVSDGVGSCPLSHIGSQRICESVKRLFLKFKNVDIDPKQFFEALKRDWLRSIHPLTYAQASATCLFAVSDGSQVFVGMLGDGAIGVVRKDGTTEMLMENKASAFSNITNSMTSRLKCTDWTFQWYPTKTLYGIMLATDGVADDLSAPEAFTGEILTSASTLGTIQSQRMMREMLINWPVPKHSDDKTIACMIF